jgi:hypothetical protein
VPAAREAHVLSLGRRRHQPFSWSASRCLLDLTLLTPRTHATDQPRKFVTSRQWLLMWECQSEPSQAEKPGLLVGSDIGLDLQPYPCYLPPRKTCGDGGWRAGWRCLGNPPAAQETTPVGGGGPAVWAPLRLPGRE